MIALIVLLGRPTDQHTMMSTYPAYRLEGNENFTYLGEVDICDGVRLRECSDDRVRCTVDVKETTNNDEDDFENDKFAKSLDMSKDHGDKPRRDNALPLPGHLHLDAVTVMIRQASNEVLRQVNASLKQAFGVAVARWLHSWYWAGCYHPKVNNILSNLIRLSGVRPPPSIITIQKDLEVLHARNKQRSASQAPQARILRNLLSMVTTCKTWKFFVFNASTNLRLKKLGPALCQLSDQIQILLQELGLRETMFWRENVGLLPPEIQEMIPWQDQDVEKNEEESRSERGYVEAACCRALLEARKTVEKRRRCR